MSKTPVISAAQQRHTLSAKKKPPKAMLKNVLAQPFEHYWPQITGDEAVALIDALNAVRLTDTESTSAWKSTHCTVGLNATLRHLQSSTDCGDCEILLLSADIRPKFIVEQILLLATADNQRKTRCLLVPGLRSLLAAPTSLGLPACMCVSFAHITSVDAFGGLLQLVNRLAERYPVPVTHQRRIVRDDAAAERRTVLGKKPMPEMPTSVRFDGLYLTRPAAAAAATTTTTVRQRAFVPAGTVFASEQRRDWSDFISLGDGRVQVTAPKRKPAAQGALSAIEQMKRKMKLPPGGGGNGGSYVTLSVNRVQGNPNKAKKKPSHKNAQKTR